MAKMTRADARRKAMQLYLSGNAKKNDGTLQHQRPPVTLATVRILTLSEIDAKYGALGPASDVRPEIASRT
jgi:hypothetical protein